MTWARYHGLLMPLDPSFIYLHHCSLFIYLFGVYVMTLSVDQAV